MNCPSRTDDTILHSDWNQNPPFLSPDLTTRQDLNGISNSREHRAGAGLIGYCEARPDDASCTPLTDSDCEKYWPWRLGVSLTQSGHPKYSPGPNFISDYGTGNPRSSSLRSSLQSWAMWIISVLVTAALISNTNLNGYLKISKWSNPYATSVEGARPSMLADVGNQTQVARRHTKRQTCAQGGVDGDIYNTSLHVGALFIILALSTLACAFPVLAIRFPRMRIPPSFLFFVSHFGTGVLIATAFVHLLPTAFTLLGDSCLSDFWTTGYPAMPGAISLAGIFLVTLIEMVFSPARHFCHGKAGKEDQEKQPPRSISQNPPSSLSLDNTTYILPTVTTLEPAQDLERSTQIRPKGPLIGRSSSFSRAMYRIGEDSERIYRIASAPEGHTLQREIKAEPTYDLQQDGLGSFHLSDTQKHNKAVMQVIMLEVGILFHSVFIGMSLSVSVGSEFVILLIAICFHQTFEGLALGSRIAALEWPEKAVRPWLMCLAYGCTTPIGQAIGIATHTLYRPDSEVGLLLVGTMNAISAGLLIFASLVELMSEDFLSDESWRVLRGRRRVIACILVFLGAFFMSLVGAWA